ncbi:hypothetical protein TrRE_jg12008, partial [Triparma retinervis]
MPPVKASNLPFTLNIIDNGNNILDFATELANATTPLAVANVCDRHTHGWPFESLADLSDWSAALDSMDAALDSLISSNPSLLLIPKTSTAASTAPTPLAPPPPSNLGPEETVSALTSILRFTAVLLRHAVNKHIYNSIQHLILLLACSSDSVASLALEALAMLASPPLLHRQQFPENQQHNTDLHFSATAGEKLMALARGWGSHTSHLGLNATVNTPSSLQHTLPKDGGNLQFNFYLTSTASASQYKKDSLVKIRLAKSFASQEQRQAAVRTRLHSLLSALYVHPSMDVLAGYFQAQPDLCREIVDLIRPPPPTSSPPTTTDTPHGIRLLAIDVLVALVSPRSDGPQGIPSLARHVNVMGELGVGKGQYMGLLPSLLRDCVSTLSAPPSPPPSSLPLKDEDLSLGLAFVSATASPSNPTPTPTIPPPPLVPTTPIDQLEFIDAVFTLISEVVAIPQTAAAMTDCGLVPALLTILESSPVLLSSPAPGGGSNPMQSIINILTVLYHSHASNQNSNMTVDGTATPLVKVIEDILKHAVEYGGVLTSLTCSLLSDIVNSDPRSLQHIHSSGLADCFFDVLRE